MTWQRAIRIPILIVILLVLVGIGVYFAWQLRTPPIKRASLATTHTVRLRIWAEQISREVGQDGQPVDVDPGRIPDDERSDPRGPMQLVERETESVDMRSGGAEQQLPEQLHRVGMEWDLRPLACDPDHRDVV